MTHCTDARSIPVKEGSVSLIVTSPPYVTSYEYADLHQLTALLFRNGFKFIMKEVMMFVGSASSVELVYATS